MNIFRATIAGYIQEVGRAGRDGELSAATLLYSPMMKEEHVLSFKKICRKRKKFDTTSGLIADKIPSDEAATMAGLSETGKRVIDYYLERMSVEKTINRLKEIVRGEGNTIATDAPTYPFGNMYSEKEFCRFLMRKLRDDQPLVVRSVV